MNMMNREDKFGKRDIIFIIALLIIAGLAFAIKAFHSDSGIQCTITIANETYGSYRLDRDEVVSIDDEYGKNTVSIQDGIVRVTDADCRDQICVHSMPLSKDEPGVIVCLPHKLVVEVK